MILEEAIKNREDCLKYLEECGPKASPDCVEAVRWSVKALIALRPVSREQVEKVWKGEWIHPHWSNDVSCADCKRCGKEACHRLYHGVQDYYNFCPACGAPMTDEAVQMVMERMNKLHD